MSLTPTVSTTPVFQAPDTIHNLHVVLDRYKDSFAELQKMKWRFKRSKIIHYPLFISYWGDYELFATPIEFLGLVVCLQHFLIRSFFSTKDQVVTTAYGATLSKTS